MTTEITIDKPQTKKILSTPAVCKELFKDFLFPVRNDKTPAVKSGETWDHTKKDKKLIRSVENLLVGIDCGQAKITIIDFDIYKEGFKDERSISLYNWCIKNSQFKYKTPRGGWHIYFKGSMQSMKLFDCIDIQSIGKYCVVWNTPFHLVNYETYEDFYSTLPTINLLPKPLLTQDKKDKKIKFGKGKNNSAIAQAAGYCANKNNIDIDAKALATMINANKHRANWDAVGCSKDFLNARFKKFYKPVNIANGFSPLSNLKLRMHTKQKITDTKWRINQWIEQGFCLIAGPPGSGKSTLAIKIAVQNAMKNTFWLGSGVGDGRKSLYICFERQKNIAFNKEIACGGNGKQIDIANDMIDPNGESISLDLENEIHLICILNLIKINNYAFVIFDPVVDLVLSNQNDNAKVRKAFNSIFDYIEKEKLDTTLLGIAHLRKERTTVDDIGSIRGAGEFANISNAVLKTRELKDNAGYLLYRLKVNQAKNVKKGAVKYKIEDCKIPKLYLEPGSKEDTKGGIKSLNYEDKPVGLLQKDCTEDIPNPNKESSFEKIKKVIDRLKAENKELNTTIVKDLAKAEGVSAYYLQHHLNWKDHGYSEHGNGKFGKAYKIVLLPLR